VLNSTSPCIKRRVGYSGPEGIAQHKARRAFKMPPKLDMNHLVPVEATSVDMFLPSACTQAIGDTARVSSLPIPEPILRARSTMPRIASNATTRARIAAHGFEGKETARSNERLRGDPCPDAPSKRKFSELNVVKQRGYSIGGLGIITIDNAMAAATGHPYCNDCMKSCIYQKQEPVDIPQVETRTLKGRPGASLGFEIYSLLTRWNPLNLVRPVARRCPRIKSWWSVSDPRIHPRAPFDE